MIIDYAIVLGILVIFWALKLIANSQNIQAPALGFYLYFYLFLFLTYWICREP